MKNYQPRIDMKDTVPKLKKRSKNGTRVSKIVTEKFLPIVHMPPPEPQLTAELFECEEEECDAASEGES